MDEWSSFLDFEISCLLNRGELYEVPEIHARFVLKTGSVPAETVVERLNTVLLAIDRNILRLGVDSPCEAWLRDVPSWFPAAFARVIEAHPDWSSWAARSVEEWVGMLAPDIRWWIWVGARCTGPFEVTLHLSVDDLPFIATSLVMFLEAAGVSSLDGELGGYMAHG